MKKRIIFDLDGTLINGSPEKEIKYFNQIFSQEEANKIINNKVRLLLEYEDIFLNYDVCLLSDFLSNNLDIKISEQVIKGWIEVNKDLDDVVVPYAKECLQYLKGQGMSLVVLTNWFREAQFARLENTDLAKYFDEVIGGDQALKPNEFSYSLAVGGFDKSKCLMIGDNFVKDVLGPSQYGIDSIYYNTTDNDTKLFPSVKSLRKIKEMF